MIEELDLNFAQELCDLVSNDLGYGCSFMGNRGVIIVSSARQRIGQVHEGAARVMRGELNEILVSEEDAARSKGMREGVSVGIDFNGKRVVCCGIAGPLDKVEPLARVLSLFLRSMIQLRHGDMLRSAEIARQVAKAKQISSEAAEVSRNANEAMNVLSEATGQISKVTALIKNIAKQTNLLALNATIEAARAGDAGRGFAVVANEVNKLSAQTTKATVDIADQTTQIEAAGSKVHASISSIVASISNVNAVIENVSQTIKGDAKPSSA